MEVKNRKQEKKLANNHNYHLSNMLGALQVAQQKKKAFFKYWPCSTFVISVLHVLRDEGYIYGFTLSEEKNAKWAQIFLKYYPSTSDPLVTEIVTYASPSRQYNITYRDLVKLVKNKPNSNYILSTPYGITTSEQCLSRAIGGNLLFKIR